MTKKSTVRSCMFLMTAMLGAHSAQADETPYPHYLTINGGLSKLTNRCDNLAVGFTCKDSAFAYSLEEGYQFNKYFGAELTLAIYGSPKTSGTVAPGSNLEVAEEVTGFRFSGTATLPLADSFALTGRLGWAQTNISVISIVSPGPSFPHYSTTRDTLAYGAGLQYNINKKFTLHVKYDYLGEIGDDLTGKHDLSLVSVGLSYHFDIAKPRIPANNTPDTSSVKKPETAENTARSPATLRVILQLKQSPADNKAELQAAIAQACLCQPYFVRLQPDQKIIYQLDLPPEKTFSDFKDTLLAADTKLGINAVIQEP